jgi:hypothetical protein
MKCNCDGDTKYLVNGNDSCNECSVCLTCDELSKVLEKTRILKRYYKDIANDLSTYRESTERYNLALQNLNTLNKMEENEISSFE